MAELNAFLVSGVESLVDGLFNYARNLAALRMNDAQLALFCAVSLISCGKLLIQRQNRVWKDAKKFRKL